MRMNTRSIRVPGIAWALLACALSAAAQDGGRDPTVAPAESSGAAGASPVGVEGMTVLVRDGKPYLVVGTRLYAVGDKVGMMRVDRISESEVWLHDGNALIKVPRFAGIERTVVHAKPTCATTASAAEPAAPAPAPVNSNKKPRRAPAKPTALAPHPPPAAAPCEDTLP